MSSEPGSSCVSRWSWPSVPSRFANWIHKTKITYMQSPSKFLTHDQQLNHHLYLYSGFIHPQLLLISCPPSFRILEAYLSLATDTFEIQPGTVYDLTAWLEHIYSDKSIVNMLLSLKGSFCVCYWENNAVNNITMRSGVTQTANLQPMEEHKWKNWNNKQIEILVSLYTPAI